MFLRSQFFSAIVQALKEAIFVNHIYEDMFGMSKKIVIITDNKAAYDIIKNPGVTKHSVHFERWIYFARNAYLHGRAKFVLTTDANMMADSLTKVTDRTKFYTCRSYQLPEIKGRYRPLLRLRLMNA